jgi:hypothetical protein
LTTGSMALHFSACEAHMNLDNESACLTADNVWNEVVTIHRSFTINCLIKKNRYNNLLAFTAH